METTHVTLDRGEAQRLYREYKKHQAYSAPIDWEVQRTYQLLAQGKVVIRALESIVKAGVDDKGLPKLAIARATAKACHLRRQTNGGAIMSDTGRFWSPKKKDAEVWRQNSFTFPPETFGTYGHEGKTYRNSSSDHAAQVPLVPIHLRPQRALQNYHVLWEAEWEPIPPRDPYLLRRIGNADLWLVVAHWDLTEVERAALATRIAVQ